MAQRKSQPWKQGSGKGKHASKGRAGKGRPPFRGYLNRDSQGAKVQWETKDRDGQPRLMECRVPREEIEPKAYEAIAGGEGIDVAFDLVGSQPVSVRLPGSEWSPSEPRLVHSANKLRQMKKGKQVEIISIKLSNSLESRQVGFVEPLTAIGAPVAPYRGKWRRIDYYGGRPHCYPYNFARAPRNPAPPATKADGNDAKAQARSLRTDHPEMHLGRYRDDCHTGWIDVEACTLSPLVISHPLFASDLLEDSDKRMLAEILEGARGVDAFGPTEIDGTEQKPVHVTAKHNLSQRIRPSAQAAPGRFILPATSVKGMLRAYLEAYSHSYMGVVSKDLDWKGEEKVKTKPPLPKLKHVDPAQNDRHWSLACRLFGRVPLKDGKGASWAGRVRVGTFEAWDADGNPTAFADDQYWWLRPLTRPSGAKAKCEALYLLPNGNRVAHYDDSQSEARGFKFYWPHSLGGPGQAGALPLADARGLAAAGPAAARDDQALRAGVAAMRDRVRGHREHQPATKTWLRPVLPGARFTGRIHFQNLTAAELGALLKAIELENPSGADFATMTHTHRIGRAKPLGFGAILLRVRACILIDTTKAYTTLGPIHTAFKDAVATTAALNDARTKFATWCNAWKSPVWDDLAALARIPDTLTDHDYWKNWTDYQPGTATPLETAS